MPKRILITGGGFSNKGAEAMTRTMYQHACERFENPQVTCAVGRGERKAARGTGLEPLWPRSIKRVPGWALAKAHALGLTSLATITGFWGRALREIPRADLVLDVSGYAFADFCGVPSYSLARARLLRDLGVPLVFMPQAWGPFCNPDVLNAVAEIVSTAQLCYARDRESHEWLTRLPSFNPERMLLAADVAFTFRGSRPAVGERLLGSAGISRGPGGFVAIIPNMRIYERLGQGRAENSYVRCLTAVARHFAAVHNCTVVVMPHEIQAGPSGSEKDDRLLCRLIAEQAATPQKVVPWLADTTAPDMKALIAQMDLIVSSRYHAIVAALSFRMPVVSLGWSHKYSELLSDLQLGHLAVPYQGLCMDTFTRLCDRAWHERLQIREHLQRTVPALERSATEAIEQALRLADR